MEQFWRGLGLHLGKRWYVVLVTVLALTGILSIGLSKLEFATGEDSYLNSDSQAAIDNVEFQSAFGGEAVVLLFTMEDGHTIDDLFTPDNLAEFGRIEEQLRAIPEAYAVITPKTSLEWSEAIANGPGTTALVSAAGRTPTPTARRSATTTSSSASPDSAPSRSESSARPTGTSSRSTPTTATPPLTPPPVQPADPTIRASLESTFPSRTVAVGGIVLKGNATLDELSSGTAAVLDVMKDIDLDGVETITTGSPVYLKRINDYLKGGMLTLGALAMGVMALILILMFKVRWRLLPLVSVLFGIAWAFSILGFIGIDLSLVTISGLPILIGMGIDFAIQVHNRVEEESAVERQSHPMMETAANVGPPLVVAVIAAVLAFLALRISRVPMIRDFGVLLAIGIVVLLAVGIIIPLTVLGAREWHRPTVERGASWSERIVVKLGSLPTSWVPAIAVVSLVLVGLGLGLESRTKIQSDPIRWIDQGSKVVKDVDTLEERTGFASTLGILIQSNNVMAPEISEVLTDFVFDAESRPEVATSSSLVGTMAKIIDIPGATTLAPTSEDLVGALDVAPPDIARALVREGDTATQVNLRLAADSLSIARCWSTTWSRISRPGSPSWISGPTTSRPRTSSATRRRFAVPAGLPSSAWGCSRTHGESFGAHLSGPRVGDALAPAAVPQPAAHAAHPRPRAAGRAGASSAIVSGLGITLSPLTTVSGLLVIAPCVEFAVLITARYLEERQRASPPARQPTSPRPAPAAPSSRRRRPRSAASRRS
ncbi:MAG: MMPL family transporter [Acidimicrobiales bacterium]